MSSSNLVRIAAIEESAYGVTPGSGNFKTARFTSEALSGTPETVASQQIRTDRMSSGQVVVGLTVGGEYSFELAKEDQIELFLASAMYSSWNTKTLLTVDLDFDAGTKELTRASGDWEADGYVVGDYIKLANMDDAENNVYIMLAEHVSATVIRVVGPQGMVTGGGTGTTAKRADKLTIGTTKKSFSMEKKFLDLTNKGINYRGMIVSQMELNVQFGELITGSFTFAGNDYQAFDQAADSMTNLRTIDPPATTDTFNGSVDMPFLASSAVGDLDDSAIDLQQVSISLNNNTQPQNAIGDIAPKDYSPGTAAIEVSLSAYLKDASWPLLSNKLSQTPFALSFSVQKNNVGYAFYLPAVQVSFEDPASGGQNQEISMEMTGTAKVGATGESALTIFRLVA